MEDNIRRNYTGHLHIALTTQTQQRTQTEGQRERPLISTELLSKIPLYYKRIGEAEGVQKHRGWRVVLSLHNAYFSLYNCFLFMGF